MEGQGILVVAAGDMQLHVYVDFDKLIPYQESLEKDLEKVEREREKLHEILTNDSFLERAPKDIIAKRCERDHELYLESHALRTSIETIAASKIAETEEQFHVLREMLCPSPLTKTS